MYDQRYEASIDDPISIQNSDSPSREILAVPIIINSEKAKNFLDLPKGVLVLINKIDGSVFS